MAGCGCGDLVSEERNAFDRKERYVSIRSTRLEVILGLEPPLPVVGSHHFIRDVYFDMGYC
jgi:hypothetical protein